MNQKDLEKELDDLLTMLVGAVFQTTTKLDTGQKIDDSQYVEKYINQIKSLLSKIERQARIEELERLHDDRFRFLDENCDPIHDRIRELQALEPKPPKDSSKGKDG